MESSDSHKDETVKVPDDSDEKISEQFIAGKKQNGQLPAEIKEPIQGPIITSDSHEEDTVKVPNDSDEKNSEQSIAGEEQNGQLPTEIKEPIQGPIITIRHMNDTIMPISTRSNTFPKPNPRLRAAVGVKKGFGMVDWLQLKDSAKDLAGRNGMPLRKITIAEVAEHSSPYDAWTVLNGKVYNITPYLHYHPGGVAELLRGAGKDCTALFNKYHPWVNIDNMCGHLMLGFLHQDEEKEQNIISDEQLVKQSPT